ncbi:MAG: galactokinase, partial [Bacteroidota bacterium]
MDQFASMFGKKGQVIQFDCRTLQYQYAPLKLERYQLVLFNTNIKHSLASTAYNQRRDECRQGVEWVQQNLPEVSSLRDVDLPMLNKFVLPKDQLIYNRCKYIVEENERVVRAVTDLNEGNLQALGDKMYATHDGLSNMYEVSCKELDLLVNIVKTEPAVLGARMMGGGFGGCTINLVEKTRIEKIVNEVSEKYRQQTG